jgi:hypothetical protein
MWFTDTGGTLPLAVAITVTHESPAIAGDGLPLRYEIVPFEGDGYMARIEFCYEDADLQQAGIASHNEESLHAYRYIGSGFWEEYSIVDPVANTITALDVVDLGVWGFGLEGNQPTSVGLQSWGARSLSGTPWLPSILLIGSMLALVGIVWSGKADR